MFVTFVHELCAITAAVSTRENQRYIQYMLHHICSYEANGTSTIKGITPLEHTCKQASLCEHSLAAAHLAHVEPEGHVRHCTKQCQHTQHHAHVEHARVKDVCTKQKSNSCSNNHVVRRRSH
jgi:hypothetical protein